ncbi:MAG: PQQ-like beta-propeller repeat protein [Gemmataceae bacterium]|nr:PQQ-like beta-propeller repeat protein [Gemmataceae bacterium]
MVRFAAGLTLVVCFNSLAVADDWPQWLGPHRNGQWRETGILEKFPAGGPKVVWRQPVAWGYSGPAVAEGRVFVSDLATEQDISKLNNPAGASEVKGVERVHCFDAKSGEPLWKHEHPCDYKLSYPGGPRCTPTVHEGLVYHLGGMGRLVCLKTDDGSVVWSKDFREDYKAKVPFWGFCSHPLVDGDKLIVIVGGENATVVAFDRRTGKEIWKALNARHPGYSAPVIIEAAGKRQLIIWDGFNLNSLDPESGTLYWSVDAAPLTEMSIMVPQHSGKYLYAAGRGPRGGMFELAADKPDAKVLWEARGTTGIDPINMTPLFDGDTLYGVTQNGQLVAVDVTNGKRLWQTTAPVTGGSVAGSGTAFLVRNGDRYFIFNEKGELIIARLTPQEFKQIDKAQVIEPTNSAFGRKVVWTHPAFASKRMFVRNDREIICYSLEGDGE